MLIGMDKPYYELAYSVSATIYELSPIHYKPSVHNLKPIKLSRLNCVPEREYGLTDNRRKMINEIWKYLNISERL